MRCCHTSPSPFSCSLLLFLPFSFLSSCSYANYLCKQLYAPKQQQQRKTLLHTPVKPLTRGWLYACVCVCVGGVASRRVGGITQLYNSHFMCNSNSTIDTQVATFDCFTFAFHCSHQTGKVCGKLWLCVSVGVCVRVCVWAVRDSLWQFNAKGITRNA